MLCSAFIWCFAGPTILLGFCIEVKVYQQPLFTRVYEVAIHFLWLYVQGGSRKLMKSRSIVLDRGGIPGANIGGKQIFIHRHFDNRL